MGRDKAWIPLAGQPLIARAIGLVSQLGPAELFISGQPGVDYSSLPFPVLRDLTPGCGPLGGIERALHACRFPLLLVLAVDLPRMTARFLQALLRHCGPFTGVVPKLARGTEPLAAVYPKRCVAIAQDCLAHAQHSAREFAAACVRANTVRLLRVDAADSVCFANCNTLADLARAAREPAPGNAGLVRQNRPASRALPDKSGAPHARRFVVPMRDRMFGIKAPHETRAGALRTPART
jgi:molybdopterin-guanine dinucleotide biosynthesis protein A